MDEQMNNITMTSEEAIDVLKQTEFYARPFDNSIEASTKAGRIHKAIYTAIDALNRDMPKEPKKSDTPRYGMGYEYYDWYCPSCGKFLAYECDNERDKKHHCTCGQRLDWKRC